MDLISMVLGILSSGSGCADFRLTLDLNRVFIRVDLPRPLWPKGVNTPSLRDHCTRNAVLFGYRLASSRRQPPHAHTHPHVLFGASAGTSPARGLLPSLLNTLHCSRARPHGHKGPPGWWKSKGRLAEGPSWSNTKKPPCPSPRPRILHLQLDLYGIMGCSWMVCKRQVPAGPTLTGRTGSRLRLRLRLSTCCRGTCDPNQSRLQVCSRTRRDGTRADTEKLHQSYAGVHRPNRSMGYGHQPPTSCVCARAMAPFKSSQ